MGNNELIKYEGGLVKRVGSAISVTNKLLVLNESQKIVNLFCKNPVFFIKTISWFYPLSNLLIDKYGWDFVHMSANNSIDWSEELIEKYKDKWVWDYGLSYNKSLPWSEKLIEKFMDKWDWFGLANNKSLIQKKWFFEKYNQRTSEWDTIIKKKQKLSETEIEEYINDHRWFPEGLSSSYFLPWSERLIEKYIDLWDWKTLSRNDWLPWSEVLVEKFIEKWDWRELSLNKSLPWSEMFIEKYKIKWDWHYLFLNEGIIWSMSLINRYQNVFDMTVRCNEIFWKKTFQPYVDDAMIEEIMQKIEIKI